MTNASLPPQSIWFRLVLPAALLLGAVLFLYSCFLGLPFVQDDWARFYTIAHNDAGDLIHHTLQPSGRIFFRPLSTLYMIAMFHLFDMASLPHHVITLMLLWGTGLMVAGVAGHFLDSRVASWAVGFLYVAAVTIHMDPLVWGVGIGAVGGAFCFMASLYLFFGNRMWPGAFFYLAALLFRDDTVTAPLVMLGASLLGLGPAAGKRISLRNLFRPWPYYAIFALYIGLKLHALARFDPYQGHPYHVAAEGSSVVDHLFHYAGWFMESALSLYGPVPEQHLGMLTLTVSLAIFLSLAGLLLRGRKHGGNAVMVRHAAFFGGWALVALGPALLLPNHIFRYYMVYSLPAILCGYVWLILAVLRQLPIGQGRAVACVAAITAIQVFASGKYIHTVVTNGVYQSHIAGTNNLVKRADMVRIVRRALAEQLPDLPRDSVLVFLHVDLNAFIGSLGPRVWYHDDSLAAIDARALRWDQRGLYTMLALKEKGGWVRRRRDLPLDQLYIFRLRQKELHLVARPRAEEGS